MAKQGLVVRVINISQIQSIHERTHELRRQSQLPLAIIVLAILAILLAGGCSSDGGAFSFAPQSAAPVNSVIPRVGHVTNSTAYIHWTSELPGSGVVSYGKTEQLGTTVPDSGTNLNHRAVLTGLEPNTRYFYQVSVQTQQGASDSAVYAFNTAVNPDTSFTFLSMGDNRGPNLAADLKASTPAFVRIVNLAVSHTEAKFTLHVGDLFYGDTHLDNVNSLYATYQKTVAALHPIMPVHYSPGNHEMKEITSPHITDPLTLFNNNFEQDITFPNNLTVTGKDKVNYSFNGTCYSFDCGNTHFVSLDSCRWFNDGTIPEYGMYYVHTAEVNWLDADLTAAQANGVRHIVVFGHANAFQEPNPPSGYDDRYMGTYSTQRDLFWAVLEKHNVDVYVCGHAHTFNDGLAQSTTNPDTNGKGFKVVQWLNGNSGSVKPPNGEGENDWTLWTVNGDQLTATLYDDQNHIVKTVNFTSRQ